MRNIDRTNSDWKRGSASLWTWIMSWWRSWRVIGDRGVSAFPSRWMPTIALLRMKDEVKSCEPSSLLKKQTAAR